MTNYQLSNSCITQIQYTYIGHV